MLKWLHQLLIEKIISNFIAQISFKFRANAEDDYIGKSIWRENSKGRRFNSDNSQSGEFSSVKNVASLLSPGFLARQMLPGLHHCVWKTYLGKKLLSRFFCGLSLNRQSVALWLRKMRVQISSIHPIRFRISDCGFWIEKQFVIWNL